MKTAFVTPKDRSRALPTQRVLGPLRLFSVGQHVQLGFPEGACLVGRQLCLGHLSPGAQAVAPLKSVHSEILS